MEDRKCAPAGRVDSRICQDAVAADVRRRNSTCCRNPPPHVGGYICLNPPFPGDLPTRFALSFRRERSILQSYVKTYTNNNPGVLRTRFPHRPTFPPPIFADRSISDSGRPINSSFRTPSRCAEQQVEPCLHWSGWHGLERSPQFPAAPARSGHGAV